MKKMVVKKVRGVEGFDVKINGSVGDYGYKRAAPKNLTVSQWSKQRMPDNDVAVLDADGNEMHGRTQLSTVRRSYQEA